MLGLAVAVKTIADQTQALHELRLRGTEIAAEDAATSPAACTDARHSMVDQHADDPVLWFCGAASEGVC